MNWLDGKKTKHVDLKIWDESYSSYGDHVTAKRKFNDSNMDTTETFFVKQSGSLRGQSYTRRAVKYVPTGFEEFKEV